MVGFDSIIPPGRAGSITQKIDIQNVHGGPFAKGVTVTSNATNNAALRLTLKGTIRAIIDASPQYLALSKASSDEVITLRTEKKDLQVTKLQFETPQKKTGLWQDQLPVYIPYSLVKTDSTDSDGYHVYKLKITNKTGAKERMDGQFVISTNHPDKKEVRLNGWIDAGSP